MTETVSVEEMKEKGFKLVQDDDCHWYLIPAGRGEEFEQWVNWMGTMTDDPSPTELDFEVMMIDSPEGLTIWEYS